MSVKLFKTGDMIKGLNGENRYKLLKQVVYNEKFYIARVVDLEAGNECFLKYVREGSSLAVKNNLFREGHFKFYYPFIERVYGTFSGIDPQGERIDGVAVEYIDGQELREYRIALQLKMEMDEISEEEGEMIIFRQILQFLYAMNYYTQFAYPEYLHRDLKPENIIITSEGDVKVVDFDYAHLSGSDKTQNVTGWDLPFSTGYTSPEIVIREYPKTMPDVETEIYSAGRVLFYWLNAEGYYTYDQTHVKKTSGEEKHMVSYPLYCLMEDLRFGFDAEENRSRFQDKYFEKKYMKLMKILDKMCADPSEERYHSVKEVIEDFCSFLKDYYGCSLNEVSEKLGLDTWNLLPETMFHGERRFVMTAYKVTGRMKVGKPLYENTMRDIMVDGEKFLTIYNFGQKVFYIPVQGIKIFRKGQETKAMKKDPAENYQLQNKDILICRNRQGHETEITFSLGF